MLSVSSLGYWPSPSPVPQRRLSKKKKRSAQEEQKERKKQEELSQAYMVTKVLAAERGNLAGEPLGKEDRVFGVRRLSDMSARNASKTNMSRKEKRKSRADSKNVTRDRRLSLDSKASSGADSNAPPRSPAVMTSPGLGAPTSGSSPMAAGKPPASPRASGKSSK